MDSSVSTGREVFFFTLDLRDLLSCTQADMGGMSVSL